MSNSLYYVALRDKHDYLSRRWFDNLEEAQALVKAEIAKWDQDGWPMDKPDGYFVCDVEEVAFPDTLYKVVQFANEYASGE